MIAKRNEDGEINYGLYVADPPGVSMERTESKERFEQRKALFKPMTDKIVDRLYNLIYENSK